MSWPRPPSDCALFWSFSAALLRSLYVQYSIVWPHFGTLWWVTWGHIRVMPFGPDLVIYSQISLIRTTLFRHNVGLARYPDNRNRKNKERNSFQSKCWQCKQRWRCSVQWTRLNGRSKGSREKYRLRRTASLSKYIDCMWNMSKWNTHFLFCFCLSADLIDRHKMVCIQNEKKAKQIFYKRPNCILQVLPLLHALCVEDWLSHFHCDLINNKVTVGVIRFSVFFLLIWNIRS